MGDGRNVALTVLAATVGTIENGQVLRLDVRSALYGLHATDADLCGLDLLPFHAPGQQAFRIDVGRVGVHISGHLDRLGRFLDLVIGKSQGFQPGQIEWHGVLQISGAHDVDQGILDLAVRVTQVVERFLQGLVHDLEEPATGQLFPFDDGEIGFDAGGVAIHQQTDGAGRRQDGHLGIAIAV